MDKNFKVDIRKSSGEININRQIQDKRATSLFNKKQVLPEVSKTVNKTTADPVDSIAASQHINLTSNSYLNDVFKEVHQVYELAKSIKLNYNTSSNIKTSNRIKAFPTPDFTELANPNFVNSLSKPHLKATSDGIKDFLSKVDKSHIANKFLSNKSNDLNTYTKILNMGIRDEGSFYNYINSDNSLDTSHIPKEPFDRSLKAFDKAQAYFKAHDRERAFYHLGNSLYHIQKSDWQNADKNTSHLLNEFFSSINQ